MDNNRLQYLLKQYFDNTISREDCDELLRYLDEGESSAISAAIDQAMVADKPSITFYSAQQKKIYDQLISSIHQQQVEQFEVVKPHGFNWRNWIKIAALLVASVSVGILLFNYPDQNRPAHATGQKENSDILLPNYNQAILTLADGRTIVLSDSLGGVLAQETGVKITKMEDGSILYEADSEAAAGGETKYNTFSTPKGHTYQLLLPDGTKVWLNTASSIRYPVAFTKHERTVSLTGEAYFEVARDASKPFKVMAGGSTVQVLGTQFNVSAYEDEHAVTTTLLEGAVNVSRNGNAVTLKPGQQAVVDGQTGEISQLQADIRLAVAWKNGYFRFDNESIDHIISKISRWYDIQEVTYQGKIEDRFTGTFKRSKGVSQLFGHLEKLAPVRFEIEERRVKVMR